MGTGHRRNIVFDLDGTLVDSAGGIVSSLAFAYHSSGVSMPNVNIRPLIGPSIDKIILSINPDIDDDQLRNISRVYRQHYDSVGWKGSVLYSNAEEVLRSLHTHAELFVVTNKPHKPTKFLMDSLRLDGLFSEILSKNSRDPPFASKASMLEVLRDERSLVASKTVFVGDTGEDCQAALQAGMRFVWASYGYGNVTAAQHKVASLPQLQRMFEQHEI